MTEETLPRRDYRCLDCDSAFSVDIASGGVATDAPGVCPACGSARVREHWESRVRNAGETPPGRFEELRDRPG